MCGYAGTRACACVRTLHAVEDGPAAHGNAAGHGACGCIAGQCAASPGADVASARPGHRHDERHTPMIARRRRQHRGRLRGTRLGRRQPAVAAACADEPCTVYRRLRVRREARARAETSRSNHLRGACKCNLPREDKLGRNAAKREARDGAMRSDAEGAMVARSPYGRFRHERSQQHWKFSTRSDRPRFQKSTIFNEAQKALVRADTHIGTRRRRPGLAVRGVRHCQ